MKKQTYKDKYRNWPTSKKNEKKENHYYYEYSIAEPANMLLRGILDG